MLSTILQTTDIVSPYCPPSAAFWGSMGVAASIVFANFGSAFGISKSGIGLSYVALIAPDNLVRSVVPAIMASVLGIYGLIVSIIIGSTITAKTGYSSYKGYAHFAAGLSVGISSLAAGMSMGVMGEYGLKSYAKQPKLYVTLILISCFQQALALYGLIVGLILSSVTNGPTCPVVNTRIINT